MTETLPTPFDKKERRPFGLPHVAILTFIAAYVACGVIYQLQSDVSPSNEKTPLEFFTRGLLWMLSLTSMLIAIRQTKSWRVGFWLLGCLALAVLAWVAAAHPHLRLVDFISFSERAEHLEPALTGQVDVEDDQVALFLNEKRLGVGAVVQRVHRVAVILEPILDPLPEGFIVFYHYDAHGQFFAVTKA